jgi:geranylgeranylglycerol-phosphate geranylgeranyltransferase
LRSATVPRGVAVRASVRSVAALTRVRTCVAAAVLCYVGDRVARAPDGGARMLASAVSIACIVAFAQAVNDIADRDVDRWAKPHRPLPSGALTVSAAKSVAVAFAAAGVLVAAAVGAGQVLLAAVLLALSWAYSYALKSTVLVGNVVVAVLASTAVLYGAVGSGVSTLALLVQAVVLSFSLAFEVAKTGVDADGDAREGLTTVATRLGIRVTALLTAAFAVFAAGVAVTPALLAEHPVRYIAAMSVTAIAPTLAAVVALVARGHSVADLDQPFQLLRVAWAAGVVSLLLL